MQCMQGRERRRRIETFGYAWLAKRRIRRGNAAPPVFVNPSAALRRQLPVRGAFWCSINSTHKKPPFGAFSYALLFFSQLCLFLYAFPYAAAYHYGPGLVVADIEAHTVGNVAVAEALEPRFAAVYHVHRAHGSLAYQYLRGRYRNRLWFRVRRSHILRDAASGGCSLWDRPSSCCTSSSTGRPYRSRPGCKARQSRSLRP